MRRFAPPRRLAAAALAATLASLWPAASAGAQEREPDMIPRDVVEALIGGGRPLTAGGDVRILVGGLPEDLEGILPAEPGADVVGSLVRAYLTEAVLDLPGTPDDVLVRWESALLERGWERHQPSSPTSRGGFATAPPGGSHQFCMGDSLTLSLDADRHEGGSRLRVTMPRGRIGVNVCRHQQDERARLRDRDESPLPVLTPPPGVRLRRAGGGGGGTDYYSRGEVETGMPVAALAEHYHAQLVLHGWDALGQAAGDDVVVHRYRVPDQAGDSPWLGMLIVTRGHGPDQRYLSLEARRDRP